MGNSTSGVVTLLTDFGTVDGYVAAMKGVILGINPSAVLVDVTHDVAPQDVRGGAFVLQSTLRYFPPRTVHLAVVDPGVGTTRAGIILDTGNALFVAPDNGILSYILAGSRGSTERGLAALDSTGTVSVAVPDGWQAVRLTESRYWLENPSDTFHGRDIFAPVAAHLSLGVTTSSFGPSIDSLRAFEIPVARKLPGGGVEGIVLYVDRFGNLITSIKAQDLPKGGLVLEIGGHRVQGLVRTYAEGSGLVALVGSSGNVEVALPGGSAARFTGLGLDAQLRILPRK
ncbi:MAG: SAM hydrolase/SAM-dependent halogenase family protein [Chloroflexota bacterium]